MSVDENECALCPETAKVDLGGGAFHRVAAPRGRHLGQPVGQFFRPDRASRIKVIRSYLENRAAAFQVGPPDV